MNPFLTFPFFFNLAGSETRLFEASNNVVSHTGKEKTSSCAGIKSPTTDHKLFDIEIDIKNHFQPTRYHVVIYFFDVVVVILNS